MMTHFSDRIRRTASGLRLALGTLLVSALAACPPLVAAAGSAAHPGALVQVGDSSLQPSHVAVDASGDVIVADFGNSRIVEIVAVDGNVNASSQVVTLATNVSNPVGLAVAPNGDVLYTCLSGGTSSTLYRLAASNGNVPVKSIPIPIQVLPVYSLTVAIDRAGDAFIGNGTAIYKIAATGGVVSPASATTQISNSFKGVQDIAFANNGDLIVDDTGASAVYAMRAVSGSITPASSVVTVASSVSFMSIGVDKQGNAFGVPQSGTPVTEMLAVNGTLSAGATQIKTSLALDQGNGVGVDGNGNVFFADIGLGVMEWQAPGQKLPPVAVGSTGTAQRIYFTFDSSDLAAIFTINESGDTAEDLDFVRSPTQPSNACEGNKTYAQGDVCAVDVIFTPKAPGRRQAAIQILNYTNQAIGTAFISGVGTGPLPQFVPGTLTLFAGAAGSNGYISGMPGPATSVNLGQNEVIRLDGKGNAYVADHDNDVLFKIDAGTGYTHIVAGQLQNGDTTGDGGPASSATLNAPAGLAIDGAGNIYLSQQNLNFAATTFTNNVRRIDAVTGIITTVAGNFTRGYSGDGGPATSAAMNFPGALALDVAGNLFIADQANCAVRRVDAVTGIITTYAGNGSCGYSGDGGIGPAAQLSSVNDLAFDSVGNLYIADANNSVVREVNAATGIITTAHGTSSHGSLQDGVAVGQAYMGAQALAFDAADNLYAGLGEPYIVRVEKVNQIVRHLAGGGSGDQVFGTPALNSIIGAYSITLDGAGNLYFVDGRQIAKITPASPNLTFKTATQVGSLDSTDNPQKAIFANIGNAPLVFSALSTGTNPGIAPANWIFDTSNTCPVTNVGSTATSLSPGQECTAAVNFEPQAPGSLTGSVVFTDNALNATAATQTITLNGTGIGGLTLTPTSISFPSTEVGSSSAAMTATLSNAGSSAVYLTKGSLSDANDFTQSDNCGGIVVAGGSCTVTFTFTPKTAASLSSTYSIADLNNQSSPLTVALSGNGTAPYGLTITPSTITFPSTAVGAASGPMTATLTLNGGSTRVNLTAGSLTDSTDFTQGDNCGGSITPNGSCVVTFTFTPKSSGALSSTYSIGLQGGGSPVTVALSGTGAAAIPSLTPSALNFGSVPVGTTSPAMNVMLNNTGNAALSIQSITFASSNGSFAQTNTCGSSLAAGASCTIAVICSPTSTGSQSSTLNVNFPSLLPTQSASLSCTGTAPTASLSPGSYAFPSTQTGSIAPSATFTLANAGTAPLAITSFSVTGTNAAAFPIASNGCGSSLAAGSSCNIAISFAPSTAGSLSAVLSVADAVGTQTATLAGTAVSPTPPDFTLAATPATQSAYHGGSVTYTVQLASVLASNPFNSAVNLSVAGLPVGATASFSPASVTPGTGQPASQLTVNIPALTAMASPASSATGVRLALLSLGGVIFLLPWSRRNTKRTIGRTLPALLLALVTGMAVALSGCGSGNGFATPTNTYTLTITGTANRSAHATTVNLTVK